MAEIITTTLSTEDFDNAINDNYLINYYDYEVRTTQTPYVYKIINRRNGLSYTSPIGALIIRGYIRSNVNSKKFYIQPEEENDWYFEEEIKKEINKMFELIRLFYPDLARKDFFDPLGMFEKVKENIEFFISYKGGF